MKRFETSAPGGLRTFWATGSIGLLCCALAVPAGGESPGGGTQLRLIAPAPNRASQCNTTSAGCADATADATATATATDDTGPVGCRARLIVPVSAGADNAAGPEAGLIEVQDSPTPDEAAYRQAVRARAMRQISTRGVRLAPIGAGHASSAATTRPGQWAQTQPRGTAEDLFTPRPATPTSPPATVPPSSPRPAGPQLGPLAPPEPGPAGLELEPAPGEPPAAEEGPTQTSLLEVLGTAGEMTVTRRRNKLIRSRENIYRVAVVDPSICDVVQFTPREVSIIGRGQGATNVTFWFSDGRHRPVTYLIRVVPDPEVQIERERQYEIFEEVLAELFPDSKVSLTPVADKLLVRGEAKDSEEAAQILAIIRGEALAGRRGGSAYSDNGANTLVDGQAASPLSGEATGNALPASNIVNMLRVPGAQQVALRVKIAELNRSAARNFGVNLDMSFDVGNGKLLLQSLLNTPGTASILGNFSNNQINFGITYLKKHGVLRILSEPTLVTLSGRPASFVAGGEFAVPTTVGVDGAAAVTTDFRTFGAILNFLPTVVDKDRIRLDISPEFSRIDSDLTVGDTPGLDTRAVTTTVEMREGQTLAIAGLLEDSMDGNKTEDIPWLSVILGQRSMTRNETELIILVTPELVHPLDPEEVPPLPGFDVTEPTDAQFYLAGRIEGTPTQEFRSTVWPRLKNRYRHGGPAMISGPFGHGQ